MFWRILAGTVRTAVAINRSVTAVGLAVVITVNVYDYLKKRNERLR